MSSNELNEASLLQAMVSIREAQADVEPPTHLVLQPWQLVKFFGWTVEQVAADSGMTLDEATEACKEPT